MEIRIWATKPEAGDFEFSRNELWHFRVLGVVAAAAIILLGLLHHSGNSGVVDPFAWRVGLATYYLAVVAVSFFAAGRGFLYLVYSAAALTTLWLCYLAAANDFSADYTLSFVIVAAAVGLLFRRVEHLLVYGGLTYAAVLVSVLLVGEPVVDTRLLMGQLGLLFVLAYIIQRIRLRGETELAASEERHALAAMGANDGLWDWDTRTDRVHFSARWKSQLGEPADGVGDDPEEWWHRVHPDDLARVKLAVADHVEGRTPNLKIEHRIRHRNGDYRWVLARGLAVRNEAGQVTRVVGSQTDVTELYRSEEALRESQRMLSTLMSHLPGMAYRCRNDPTWTIEFVSEGALPLTGYRPDDLVGNARVSLGELIHSDDRNRVWTEVQAALESRRPFQLVYRLITAAGEERWVWEQGEGVPDGAGGIAALEGFITDITERKRAEDQLVHDALHDGLTGLPNRALFLDRVEQTMKHARRRDSFGFAVLFLDLDRFKLINDSLGHLTGDELLKAVAKRIQTVLRAEDTVARLGGDEFAILLGDLDEPDEAALVAERIQSALERPFRIGEREVFASATLGIALGAPIYGSPVDVLRDADTAMYRAKAQARGGHATFNADMHTQVVAQLQLENDLRRVLERGELRLLYQPIVRLPGRRLFGFEALLRWQHPDRGLLLPKEFIPVAEETGLIVSLGWWVLAEACERLRSWRARWPSAAELVISVNLSGKQFGQPDLVERIESVLTATDLPASSLHLEITESVVMREPKPAAAKLARLREHGARIAIDDFGTGYSSLSYLHQFPIDFLKIDRVFVNGLEAPGAEPRRLVQTMISLADSLGLDTIGEGVETEDQLAVLEMLGCRYAQGHLFSKPLDEAAVEAIMIADRTEVDAEDAVAQG